MDLLGCNDVTGGSRPGARASRPHNTGTASALSPTRLDRQRRHDCFSRAHPGGRVTGHTGKLRPPNAENAGETPALPRLLPSFVLREEALPLTIGRAVPLRMPSSSFVCLQ